MTDSIASANSLSGSRSENNSDSVFFFGKCFMIILENESFSDVFKDRRHSYASSVMLMVFVLISLKTSVYACVCRIKKIMLLDILYGFFI